MKYSTGNTKIGKTMNVSLLPGASCRGEDGKPLACYNTGCYARGSCEQYKETAAAWGHNLLHYFADAEGFFADWAKALEKVRPALCRVHVGGEVPDADYMRRLFALVAAHPRTDFQVFTKRYAWANEAIRTYGRPKNLFLLFSIWPGVPFDREQDNPFAIPEAHLLQADTLPIGMVGGLCMNQRQRKSSATAKFTCQRCHNYGVGCFGVKDGAAILFVKH